MAKKPNNGDLVRCTCGKLLAIERGGKLFLFCRRCRRETEIPIYREPRAREAKSR